MDIQSTIVTGNGVPLSGEPKFSLTENAARRINELVKAEAAGACLRISVNGGGCSGFQYEYNFVLEKNSDDHVFERDGAKILIDEMSLGFISGSELDYVETMALAEFQIKNPKASATCGCGNSFAV